jgi:hypothetical protein
MTAGILNNPSIPSTHGVTTSGSSIRLHAFTFPGIAGEFERMRGTGAPNLAGLTKSTQVTVDMPLDIYKDAKGRVVYVHQYGPDDPMPAWYHNMAAKRRA